MKQEDRELLLKDLCARLLYGIKGRVYAECSKGEYDMYGDMIFFDSPFDVTLDDINISTEEIHVTAIGNEDTVDFIEEQQTLGNPYIVDEFEPYLRPMSSMTEEEVVEFESIAEELLEHGTSEEIWDTVIDWLNAHHFDHRHLIEKGLAIEAPEEIYKDHEKE